MTDHVTKKIGLCRHFPIPDISSWQIMTTKSFNDWIHFNEKITPVEDHSFSPLIGWDICFSSDLPRAKITAASLVSEIPIHTSSLFREVPYCSYKIPFILPKGTWLLVNRLQWIMGGKTPERKKETLLRGKKAVETLLKRSEHNILVITHGFFMHALVKELKLHGYEGSIPTYPEYGKVNMFEKKK